MTSPGERMFAAYLRQQGFAYKFEPVVGGRRPDFLVDHTAGPFVAEVFEPEVRLPPGGGRYDSYTALRRCLTGRKAKQIKASGEAGYPCVLVVAGTNADLPFVPEFVAGAMFGDVSVQFSVGPESNASDARTVFGSGGRVQPNQFRHLSAMAIVKVINPTYWRVEQAIGDCLGPEPAWQPGMSPSKVRREQSAVAAAVANIHEHMAATRTYIEEARIVTLTVLHNPYARRPLGFDVLNGPHDVQWANAERDGVRGYGPAEWREFLHRECS